MILGQLSRMTELTETAAAWLLLPLYLLFSYLLSALLVLVVLALIGTFIKMPSIPVLVFNIIVSFVTLLLSLDFFITYALGKSTAEILVGYILSAILVGLLYAIFSLPAYAMFGNTVIIPDIVQLLKSIAQYAVTGIIYALEWGIIPVIFMIVYKGVQR